VKIAAISDFHICAKGYTDCFQHDEQSFLAFLDKLEEEHDHIVLLGDIYQTDHSIWRSERADAKELQQAQRRTHWLTERILRPKYHLLFGNHDMVIEKVLQARETLRLEADDFAVYFIHGHQFDPVITETTRWYHCAVWINARLRRFGLRRLVEWMEDIDVRTKARLLGEKGNYHVAAQRFMKAENAQLVVMGHTHIPEKRVFTEGAYINTGTCSRGQFMYASIDTKERKAQIYEGLPKTTAKRIQKTSVSISTESE